MSCLLFSSKAPGRKKCDLIIKLKKWKFLFCNSFDRQWAEDFTEYGWVWNYPPHDLEAIETIEQGVLDEYLPRVLVKIVLKYLCTHTCFIVDFPRRKFIMISSLLRNKNLDSPPSPPYSPLSPPPYSPPFSPTSYLHSLSFSPTSSLPSGEKKVVNLSDFHLYPRQDEGKKEKVHRTDMQECIRQCSMCNKVSLFTKGKNIDVCFVHPLRRPASSSLSIRCGSIIYRLS